MTAELEISRLKENPYPGRGIVIGLSEDRLKFYQIYWVMGRSQQSRNRIFVEENGFLFTRVYDENKTLNPELLIYSPMRHIDNKHIVTNGNHTNIIEKYLIEGKTFFEALLELEYEPDAPHFTPRIAGIVDADEKNFSLAVLKKYSFSSDGCLKAIYCYDNPPAGIGYCIHTYNTDGNPLPSFVGEPYQLPLFNSITENLEFYWNLLNPENRVSLAVKEIEIENCRAKIEIINKNK
ncbi:MAG: IMP cyclohydrolase [Brevinematia bacterium]